MGGRKGEVGLVSDEFVYLYDHLFLFELEDGQAGREFYVWSLLGIDELQLQLLGSSLGVSL